MPERTYLTDQFLLSMPQLEGDYFASSLIYLCDHNTEGALGLVINKQSPLTVWDLFEHLELPTQDDRLQRQPVYLGGPVSDDRGFILHSRDGRDWASSLIINAQLALTTSKDLLIAIADNEAPEQYLISLGYSGWGSNQLEQELSDNAWLTCPADPSITFANECDSKLTAAAELLGIDLSLLTTQAGHA